MSKINLLLTEANGNLADRKTMIAEAVGIAEEYAFSKLKIDWDIDVLVTNRVSLVFPENGAGGYTFTSDFIRINIDNQTVTKNAIAENVAHELCHAARWGKNDERMETLFDVLIFEGLACAFEEEFAEGKTEKTLFLKTIVERSDGENKQILESIRDKLHSNKYHYDEIFFTGNDALPRWAGYSLGYYLVRKYLAQTGKKIENAFADKYADFRLVFQEDC